MPQIGPRIHLVSTVRNEGPWLVEWLAYHRTVGVTDFTIFSNDCTDGTNLMLDRLQQLGVLRHFDNPLAPRMDPQRRAYSRAAKMEAVRAADWVLVIDADEFVNVHSGGRTLPDLIAACGAPDAISIPWRLMGSAGHGQMTDEPVTRRFTLGASFAQPENGLSTGFKTLFRPGRFDYFGVHRPRFDRKRDALPEVRWTDASGTDLGDSLLRSGWRFGRGHGGHDHAQVNHYAVKSREEFLLKRLRGTANSKDRSRLDMGYWARFDLNSEPDRTIPLAGLDAAIAELRADPDLAALERACLLAARRRLDAELEDPVLTAFVQTGALPEAAE